MNKDLDEYIGRWAVCRKGEIGIVEAVRRIPLPGTVMEQLVWDGHNVFTGDSWSSRKPTFINEDVQKRLEKSIIWLKDQEAD